MLRFRKRPHEVQAFQWKGWDSTADIPEDIIVREANFHMDLWVKRLHNWVRVSLGDWIIADRYQSGYYDVCPRWQFAEDYDPLDPMPSDPPPPSRPRNDGLI